MSDTSSLQDQAKQAPRRASIFSTLAAKVGEAFSGRGAERQRVDAYLNESTSIADLESRMRSIERDQRNPRGGGF